jgi:hypothetical protein
VPGFGQAPLSIARVTKGMRGVKCNSMKPPRRVLSVLIVACSFIIGTAAGFGWSWWKDGGRPKHTAKLALIKLSIDDANCDSGFQVDWLANSHLVSPTGERQSKLAIPASEEGSCEDERIFIQALVQPSDSWVYRFEIASPSVSTVIDKFTVRDEMWGSSYGPAYAYISLSADCSSGTLLCP